MKIGLLGDQRQHIAQQRDDLLSQQQRGQQRLQGGVHPGNSREAKNVSE